MGDRWTLELLLTAAPWISGSRTLEDKYLSAMIGAAEMVLKGCTAAYDLPPSSRCRRSRACRRWPAPTPRSACAR